MADVAIGLSLLSLLVTYALLLFVPPCVSSLIFAGDFDSSAVASAESTDDADLEVLVFRYVCRACGPVVVVDNDSPLVKDIGLSNFEVIAYIISAAAVVSPVAGIR
eukprot:8272320-Ditylum_brightwellii.AAC.1